MHSLGWPLTTMEKEQVLHVIVIEIDNGVYFAYFHSNSIVMPRCMHAVCVSVCVSVCLHV